MKRKSRPEVLNSKTYKLRTSCGNLYLRFGYDDKGNLYEAFFTLGKSGNCVYGLLVALSRLICDLFKYEIELEDKEHAIKHLLGINCGNGWVAKGQKHLSCLDLIAKTTLAELQSNGKEEKK